MKHTCRDVNKHCSVSHDSANNTLCTTCICEHLNLYPGGCYSHENPKSAKGARKEIKSLDYGCAGAGDSHLLALHLQRASESLAHLAEQVEHRKLST